MLACWRGQLHIYIKIVKIALIFPNKDRKDKTVHLGLGYLASYARSVHTDIEITIFDTRVATKAESTKFFKTKFDLIGITVLSPVLHEVKMIFTSIRKNQSAAMVCLGGPYVTTIMEDIFTYIPTDFAVYGEGELTFSELIFHLKSKMNIKDIRGLIYKSPNGEIITNPPREQISNLDQMPFPAYDLFQMNRYPVHRIVTSRGCPYKCSFCNSSSIWQYKWRARSPENLIEEIEFLSKNYKNKTFVFSDNTFNVDMDRVNEFCNIIIEKRIKILWSTPVRVDKITKELAIKMKNAGCYNVGIGIESANNKVLDSMGKRITIEEITKGIEIFKSAGIEVLGQFVIGSPGDTLQTVEESIIYARNSGLDFVMFYSVLPFKGTPQWDYVKNHGKLYSETIHDFHSTKPRIVFETPEFSYPDRLKAIKLATDAGYYSDSNDRSYLFDVGRNLVKNIQIHLPFSISSRIYLASKNIYRRIRLNKTQLLTNQDVG